MSRPVLLVAGGSRGIGAATAKLAGAKGYDVAVNYNSNANAAAAVVAAVKAAGGKAVALQGDMGKEEDIERVFAQTGTGETATSASSIILIENSIDPRRLYPSGICVHTNMEARGFSTCHPIELSPSTRTSRLFS